ncbi:hypothetical protein Sjap_026610 [Stephania japonica]|uniref:DNA-directed DNA polymerase n=1 Tax=Stephania japonica TaxID=461633 RepID=A0AAP0HAU1_9MAGN
MTEICNQKEYEEFMKKDYFQSAEKLNDHYYIVNYITNSSFEDDVSWIAPKMSAIQLAAAITACARIHMYPHISRPDCYYTDTDSIVLGSPLSDDFISSYELDYFVGFEDSHHKVAVLSCPRAVTKASSLSSSGIDSLLSRIYKVPRKADPRRLELNLKYARSDRKVKSTFP